MTEYTVQDLAYWDEKIAYLVKACGLDCYDQHFEICTYEDMLCYEAYVGMPSHYPHWSYGKAYERLKTFYHYNLVGLPYEMVINSNPCIAYLMRDNTLLLQILTMAHVYGHNDFFKHNRLFRRDTRADLAVEMFKGHARRVRSYMQNPGIGPEKVERILNAAHAIRFQTSRCGEGKTPSREQLSKDALQPVPDRLSEDLLAFLGERAQMQDWERDLVHIVHEESMYFIPQIETKIMNEGWASYWHYQILQQLDLPQGLHLEFLQRHNLVIRPYEGRVNPYFVGFKMYQYLAKQAGGLEKILKIRQEERDQAFLRRYLNQDLCEELHLFSYKIRSNDIVVDEIADEEGWQGVRERFANAAGLGSIPAIRPLSVDNGTLVLEHIYDGRELEMGYAKETLKYIIDLWGGRVELHTRLDDRNKVIGCSDDKVISVRDK